MDLDVGDCIAPLNPASHEPDPALPHYGVKLERRPPVRLKAHRHAQDNEDAWIEWARMQTTPLAVDLFAGGGGLSLGLERAGFKVALSVDTDPWSVETHAHNFGGLSLDWDLSDLATRQRLIELLRKAPIGIVAGGPPCQPFSRAGRSKIRSLVRAGSREEVDTRRDLWRAFLDVVIGVRPQAVLMENVPDMALSDDVAVVRVIVDELEAAGYSCNVDIRKAWEHGVPQHRQRLIVVATLDAPQPFSWPQRSPRETVFSAIDDLPELGDSTGSEKMPYRGPNTKFQKRARGAVHANNADVVYDHVTRPVRADDRVAFGLMDPTTKYSDLPASLRRYRDDSFDDKYKRLDGNDLSRTITAHIAKDGYWYIHPTEPRTLTVREAARIQTFPDSYRFAGTRSAAFRQIGNAVPPALAYAIGRRIRTALTPNVLPDGRRPMSERERVDGARAALDVWIDSQVHTPWRTPSTPWHAVVGALCSRVRTPRTTSLVLSEIPTPEDATRERCEEVAASFQSSAARRAIGRLPAIAAGLTNGCSEVSLDLMSPAEVDRAALYTDGSGATSLAVSSGTTRVASRVLGNAVGKNQLTTGKLAVARLVGSGAAGQGRMTALLAVAEDYCFAAAALCGDCPLSRICRESPRGPEQLTTDS